MSTSPELARYARHEYRQQGDFDLSLQTVLRPPVGYEKPASERQIGFGKVFQRRVMNPIERVRAPIIDSTAVPIAGIAKSLVLGSALLNTLGIINVLNRMPKYPSPPGNFDIGNTLLITALELGGLYIFSQRDQIRMFYENSSLQPSRQLELTTYPLGEKELSQDTATCISEMNNRVRAFTDLGNKVETQTTIEAVHAFMKKVYGFDTPSTRRPKIPRNKSRMASSKSGFTHPLIGEVVVLSEDDHSTIAHEMTHTQGVMKESEAEFASIVALLEADDPRLQYYGYGQWLNRLVQAQTPIWFGQGGFEDIDQKQEAILTKLRELGLNNTCIQRKEDEWKKLKMMLGKRKMKRSTPSIQARYAEKPVELLHSYKVKYLSTAKENV